MILSRRPNESEALLQQALRVALDNDLPDAALRAYYNLAYLADLNDRFADGLDYGRRGLALARRRGDRFWEQIMLSSLVESLILLGEWDEALQLYSELGPGQESYVDAVAACLARVYVARGDLDAAREVTSTLPERPAEIAEIQARAGVLLANSIVSLADNRSVEAADEAEQAASIWIEIHNGAAAADALAVASDAALALGDADRSERLLAACGELPPAERTQYLEAHMARARAGVVLRPRTGENVEPSLESAVARFRKPNSRTGSPSRFSSRASGSRPRAETTKPSARWQTPVRSSSDSGPRPPWRGST